MKALKESDVAALNKSNSTIIIKDLMAIFVVLPLNWNRYRFNKSTSSDISLNSARYSGD